MGLRNVWKSIALFVALATSNLIHAQPAEVRYAEYDFEKLMYSFDESLHSKIPGIVESTIYNLVEYKSYFPHREYSRFDPILNEISRRSTDSTIAYKAGLAKLYLSYGSTVDDPSVFNPNDHGTAFKNVAEQLVRKFLISRSTR